MQTVGIRELKNRLSEYVRRVRAGETVLVSDRGEIVAELSQPRLEQTKSALPPGLMALADRGLLTIGAPGGTDLYPALPIKKGLQQVPSATLLDEERGSR